MKKFIFFCVNNDVYHILIYANSTKVVVFEFKFVKFTYYKVNEPKMMKRPPCIHLSINNLVFLTVNTWFTILKVQKGTEVHNESLSSQCCLYPPSSLPGQSKLLVPEVYYEYTTKRVSHMYSPAPFLKNPRMVTCSLFPVLHLAFWLNSVFRDNSVPGNSITVKRHSFL